MTATDLNNPVLRQLHETAALLRKTQAQAAADGLGQSTPRGPAACLSPPSGTTLEKGSP